MQRDFLSRPLVTGQGNKSFKLEKDRFRLDVIKKFFTMRFAWRSCECPISGNLQGQVGWSFEQPSEDKGVQLDLFKGPFQLKLFCDSKITFNSCTVREEFVFSQKAKYCKGLASDQKQIRQNLLLALTGSWQQGKLQAITISTLATSWPQLNSLIFWQDTALRKVWESFRLP